MERKLNIKGIQGVPDYEIKFYGEKKHKIALIIPVLNEGSRIVTQLNEMRNLDLEVDLIIADGGSQDGLHEFIESGNFKVHAFLTKKGSGRLSAQLRMGFHYCMTQKYEAVITMDGNNKDDPTGVNEVIKALGSGSDFVQGSRFIAGGKAINTPTLRFLAIRFLHAPVTSLASRFWYTDTTNGFRGHSERLIQHPEIQVFREIFFSYELLAYIPIRAKQGSQEAVLLEQGKLLTKDKIVYCGSVNTSGNLVFNISNEYYGIVNEGVTRFDTAGSVVYNKIYLRLLPNGSLY
jgi:glycosyltransferase involved in cell wall biosynthesis